MNIRCYFGIICCLISTTFKYSLNLQVFQQEDLGGEVVRAAAPHPGDPGSSPRPATLFYHFLNQGSSSFY